jgi:hypothetical protein
MGRQSNSPHKFFFIMSSSCNQVQAPVISATLAAGSVASPFYIMANISQRLCFKTCADNTPVFAPRFSVLSFAKVGTSQYMATCHVEGIISYIPCGGDCSCTRQQPLSANFTIPFYATTTPVTVSLAQGVTINDVATVGCQNCSRQFVSETPLSLTVSSTATAANE